MKSWSHPIQAVVFDCDGVLLDTMKLYRQAATDVIGQPYTEEFQSTVNALSEWKLVAEVVSAFNLTISPEEYRARRAARLKELLPQADLVNGIESIVNRLKEMNIPMAIATSANRTDHEMKIARHRAFFASFQAMICGDEVSDGKPSPEIFQKAAASLGPFSPQNVLVFEDAINGIKAANSAGMASVFLANPRLDWQTGLDNGGVTPSLIVLSCGDFDFNAFDWQPP
jgi:pseudouridine-5'-monophosphatase